MYLLTLPVDREVLDGVPALGLRLPAAVRASRAPQRDAVRLTAGDEQRRINVCRIDQVLARGQALGDEGLLNKLGVLRLMDGGGGRLDMREQVGRGRLARLADMDQVPRPLCVPFVAAAGVDIVGRFDALGGR